MIKTTLKNKASYIMTAFFLCLIIVIGLSSEALASSPDEDGIPVDAEHFPDEAFRSYVNEEIAGGDGMLSAAEISSITAMDCSNLGISTLTGIEVFTQLTDLDCSENSLSTLDVSDLSSLQRLICSKNALTYLRVIKYVGTEPTGGCFGLEYLSCEDNQLAAINLGYCQNFQWIRQYIVYSQDSYRLTPQSVKDTHYYFSNANKYLCIDDATMVFVPGQASSCEIVFNVQSEVYLSDQEGRMISSPFLMQHIMAAERANRPEDPDAVEWPKTPGSRHYVLDGWYTDSSYTKKFDFSTLVCNRITLYGRFLPVPSDYTPVSIDENSFPDDSFREYVLNVVDDGDGILSAAEVAVTTNIDCSAMGIQDCSGIELFTNLISFNCSENELTSLDLQKQTKLKILNCSENLLTGILLGSSEGECGSLRSVLCCMNQMEELNLQYCTLFHDMPIEYLNNEYQITPQHIYGDRYVYEGSDYYLIADEETTIVSAIMEDYLTVDFLLGDGQGYFIYQSYDAEGYPIGNPIPAQVISFGGKVERPVDPVRAHSRFDGWYTDPGCTNRFDFDDIIVDMSFFSRVSHPTMALYAKWVDLRREVSFFCNGSLYAKQNVDCGQTVSRPESGTNMDGGFDGWYTDEECTQRFDFNTPIQENLSLYSKLLINDVTFPDAGFLRYVGAFDVDGDGALSQAEINSVTTISCGNSEIISLRGIEYFTSLVTLECFNNELTSLNLERNAKLKSINCSHNKLTSLNLPWDAPIQSLNCCDNQLYWIGFAGRELIELDCSLNNLSSINLINSPELIHLYCNGNQFGSLDVSHNTKLQFLGCGSNGISTLNLTSNPELRDIYCGNNTLTTLDLTYNSVLDYLNCENNRITALNISNNTMLSGLNCDGNRIAELNLNANTELTFVNCANNQISTLVIDGCAKLETLVCFGNLLTTLDLSHNSELVGLWCNDNKLQALDIHGLTKIANLNCSNNQLTSLNLSGCAAITTVSCAENPLVSLDASGCSTLSALNLSGYTTLAVVDLSDCTALTELILSNNNLTTLDFSGCTALERIDCSHNQLTLLDVSGCSALTELHCGDNRLTSLQVNGCTLLTRLVCCNNQLTLLEADACVTLEELDCSSNQLTTLVTDSCSALTILNCSDNLLTSLVLENNTALVELDCSSNMMPTLDTKYCTNLLSLRCSNNRLIDLDIRGCSVLAELDCQSNRLTILDLAGFNNLRFLLCDANGMTELDVTGCVGLTSLYCFNNLLTELDVSTCTSLAVLECSQNRITQLVLPKTTTLETIYFNDNCVSQLPFSFTDYPNLNRVGFANNNLEIPMLVINQGPEFIECDGNRIDILDISNHPVLVQAYKYSGVCIDSEEAMRESYGAMLVFRDYSSPYIFYGYADLETDQWARIDVSPETEIVTDRRILTRFPDKVFRKMVMSSFDLDHDGMLNQSELDAVIEIDCHNLGIIDLTGVELFEKLQKLDCRGNTLETFDLTHNAELLELSCTGEAFSLVDLSYNAKLEKLHVDAGTLSSIDLSGCMSVKQLEIAGGQFTSLDLSNRAKLESFVHQNGNLVNLDLSGNGNLTRLISDNRLQSLGLTGCKKLAKVELIGENSIQMLDVRYFPTLDAYVREIVPNGFVPGSALGWEGIELVITSTSACEVVFNSNGGTTFVSQSVLYGTMANYPGTPSRGQDIFRGWFSDEACTIEYDFGTAVISNLTLYAKWQSLTLTDFTVKYHETDDSPASLMTSTITYGVSQKSLTVEALGFQQSGKKFKGWKVWRDYDNKWYVKDANGKSYWATEVPAGGDYALYVNGESVGKTTVAGTTAHFYAQWEDANLFTVKYYQAENSSASSKTSTVVYGVSQKTLTVETLGFQQSGKKFKGWKVYRDYDSKWYVKDANGSKYWATAVPAGGDYALYVNGESVGKTTVAGTTAHFYAQWE